jgi:gas vesicle protein
MSSPESSSSSSSPLSSSAEVEELRTRAVREQVDLYRQLREQLINEIERYQKEGNHKLASIISESLRE